MSYKETLMHLNDAFNKRGLLEDVYEACRNMDMPGAVISALRVLRNTGNLQEIKNMKKSKKLSNSYRIEGNTIYTSRQCLRVQGALGCYNKALLCAPKDSKEQVLAYSNRSALLLKLKAYSACLKDIETCFRLQLTEDQLKKLTIRKEECEKNIWKENLEKSHIKNSFTEEFFKIKGKTHPEVPCLSADVDLVSESGEIKAVAVKDIPVGTVLVVETAITTSSEVDKSLFRCYYCQNMSLNLVPCDNCCYAMFCSKKCRKLCLNEYHLIECQIMDALQTVDIGGNRFQLAIKTVLKLKSQCKQWSTLIKESQNIGANRLNTSTMNEIYDVKNYSSILSFNDHRHFIHGILYNSCFVYAIVIHHLQKISGFFPVERKDCLEAQKCLAKLLTMLELMWPSATQINNIAQEVGAGSIAFDLPSHYGFFSFTSKLKHSCDPNVLVLGMDNQVGLVAIQRIKKKSELKISYVGHWSRHLLKGNQRIMRIYHSTFNVCTCRVCKEGWNANNLTKSDFKHFQMSTYLQWIEVKESSPRPYTDALFFKETCKTLTALHKQARTTKYQTIFSDFCTQLGLCQFVASNNYRINF